MTLEKNRPVSKPRFACLAVLAALFAIMMSSPCAAEHGYLMGSRDPVRNDVDTLLNMLRGGKLEETPQQYFGKLHDPALADLVMFADTSGEIKVALIRNGRQRSKLFGQKRFWAMIFAAMPSDTREYSILVDTTIESYKVTIRSGREKGAPVDDTLAVQDLSIGPRITCRTLEVKLECLVHQLDGGEIGFISTVRGLAGSLFSQSLGESKRPRAMADTIVTEKLEEIKSTHERTGDKLFFAMVKLPLVENAIHRVRVEGLGDRRAYATFGNYSASRVGASLALVALRTNNSTRSGWNTLDPKAYVLLHYHLVRPNLPSVHRAEPWYKLRKTSFSTFFGVQLAKGNILDNVALGAGLGHAFGMVGIVAGVNLQERTRVDATQYYVGEPFIGLNYDL